jgi:gamma-glutamyltranspeptidase / glutathione hydrolase
MRQDFERLFKPDGGPRSGFPRMPAIAGEAMVATSHPLATRAGVRELEDGGNAVDVTLAAAAVLPVVEPNLNGLGGDCFAIVRHGDHLAGLNGSGRSPAVLDGEHVDCFGPAP